MGRGEGVRCVVGGANGRRVRQGSEEENEKGMGKGRRRSTTTTTTTAAAAAAAAPTTVFLRPGLDSLSYSPPLCRLLVVPVRFSSLHRCYRTPLGKVLGEYDHTAVDEAMGDGWRKVVLRANEYEYVTTGDEVEIDAVEFDPRVGGGEGGTTNEGTRDNCKKTITIRTNERTNALLTIVKYQPDDEHWTRPYTTHAVYFTGDIEGGRGREVTWDGEELREHKE